MSLIAKFKRTSVFSARKCVHSWGLYSLPLRGFSDNFLKPSSNSKKLKGVEVGQRSVYLDMQATTPMDPRVLESMMPFFTERFGNPHSRNHMYGWEADEAVEDAREQIAKLINADKREIIFTSGATEANNMAVKGIAEFYKAKKNHIIALQTEHKCVLDSCRFLETKGFEVTYLPVKSDGLVDLTKLETAIRPGETSLVAAMLVNNEIGVRQPVHEIGAICKKHKVHFHCDAAQAVGKIPVDVKKLNCSTLSISGHKMYGPKGVGALFIRRKPRVRIVPLFSGGGQERGLRSGTLSPPLCVGIGTACDIAKKDMDADYKHVKGLSSRLEQAIMSQLSHVTLNGNSAGRFPGTLNLSFAGVEGESLLMGIDKIAVSSGSACTSASLEPSYVLRALGVAEDMAHTSIRFGIGRFTTEAEVDLAAVETVRNVKSLRKMSPLWEMIQSGVDINKIQWANL